MSTKRTATTRTISSRESGPHGADTACCSVLTASPPPHAETTAAVIASSTARKAGVNESGVEV